LVSASQKEGQGTESLGFLDPKRFESLNKAKSSLPTEVYCVTFQVLVDASIHCPDDGGSIPNLRYYPGICLEGLTKATKTSVMVDGLQAEN
jgi:hypothetical protein